MVFFHRLAIIVLFFLLIQSQSQEPHVLHTYLQAILKTILRFIGIVSSICALQSSFFFFERETVEVGSEKLLNKLQSWKTQSCWWNTFRVYALIKDVRVNESESVTHPQKLVHTVSGFQTPEEPLTKQKLITSTSNYCGTARCCLRPRLCTFDTHCDNCLNLLFFLLYLFTIVPPAQGRKCGGCGSKNLDVDKKNYSSVSDERPRHIC